MQDTTKNNILIALFMGWKIDNSFPDKDKVYRSPNNDLELTTTFKFHLDWNKLMPVVEKINTISVDNFGELYVVIHPTHCTVREGDGNDLIVKHTDKGLLLDAVYLTIVEFVKWYNEQISKNGQK